MTVQIVGIFSVVIRVIYNKDNENKAKNNIFSHCIRGVRDWHINC